MERQLSTPRTGRAGALPFLYCQLSPAVAADNICRKAEIEMVEQVIDNRQASRFELPIGDEIAVAYYRLEDGRVVLTHTEVPQALSGQGIGTRLATGVFDILRAQNARVIAKCPFMAAFAAKHPDYMALLDG